MTENAFLSTIKNSVAANSGELANFVGAQPYLIETFEKVRSTAASFEKGVHPSVNGAIGEFAALASAAEQPDSIVFAPADIRAGNVHKMPAKPSVKGRSFDGPQ